MNNLHFQEQTKKFKNTECGITLIALVISIIVLLILARHKYFHVKSATTAYFHELEKPKRKQNMEK